MFTTSLIPVSPLVLALQHLWCYCRSHVAHPRQLQEKILCSFFNRQKVGYGTNYHPSFFGHILILDLGVSSNFYVLLAFNPTLAGDKVWQGLIHNKTGLSDTSSREHVFGQTRKYSVNTWRLWQFSCHVNYLLLIRTETPGKLSTWHRSGLETGRYNINRTHQLVARLVHNPWDTLSWLASWETGTAATRHSLGRNREV